MSVDIVNLIESNPITKLSGDYQSKLVEKIKNVFTDYEQQLFLSSFYCYLKYDSKNDFVIDLDNVWNWLVFSSKHKAKELLNKYFIIDKDYKYLLTHLGEQTNALPAGKAKKSSRGGHNKETIMLNVETFKKFCLKAGTKKADEIHDYFIKLENIMFEIAKEECDELKNQLKSLEHTKNKETEEKIIKQKEQVLLKEYANSGALIYIIKVKTYDNGTYVVKIGHSTKGIHHRYTEHKSNYDECLLLNCFKVDKSKEFETFLHQHMVIHPTKVTNLIGHEKENELFLIGTTLTYQILLKLIEDNIDNYNYKVRELLLELEVLRLQTNNQPNVNDELLKELITTNKLLVNKVNNLETYLLEIHNKLNAQETKVVTGFGQQMPHLGPRLQKINPENLQLIKVYESVTEAMNENKDLKRPSITKAIEENTIYCGFRWLLVERNLNPNIIHFIQPTKRTKTQHIGYVAKLNIDKTEIVNIYLDRKTAAILNGYKSSSALDNHVKNETVANGHYYMLYDDCKHELIAAFEGKHGIPLLYKNGIGQYDLQDKLIQEFSCKYECIRELKMSDRTLDKALTNNIPYNNYYYKELGSKVKYL